MQYPLRSPKVIYTDRYLNDPIKFDADPRFDPESLLFQVTGSNGVQIYERDQADFVQVNLNSITTLYDMINMFSPIYDPEKYRRVIDRQFRQFVTQSITNG